MRNLKKTLFIILAILPSIAYCGNLAGTIQSILFNKDLGNIVFVQINGTATGAPSCATATSRMVIDISIPVAKALLANLIAVKLSNPNTVVTLVGTGSCTLWGDTESFSYTFL